ncbi:MAG: OsmC family protein, partial [Catenulispora sp.]
LARHGLEPEGLEVRAAFHMAGDRPPRVAGVRLTVKAPESLPAERRAALLAVVSHCTVHNTLTQPPTVVIDVA